MSEENSKPSAPYLVALRRHKRADAPVNWIEMLKKTPGVSAKETVSKQRIMIQADDDAIEHLKSAFGDYCHVEPLIRHHRSEQTADSLEFDSGVHDEIDLRDLDTTSNSDDEKPDVDPRKISSIEPKDFV